MTASTLAVQPDPFITVLDSLNDASESGGGLRMNRAGSTRGSIS
jgi:hypothetical protein